MAAENIEELGAARAGEPTLRAWLEQASAGMTSGTIDPALIIGVVRSAGAPVICETPDPAADIRWLHSQLAP